LLSKTPVLLGAAMIIEAVVLFAGFKFVGGGRTASAAGAELALSEGHDAGSHEPGAGSDTSPDDPAKTVEINLLDFKAPNSRSGRNFLYDVSIYVVTKGEHQKTVSQAIQAREALIKDRVRTIIAESDPDKLGGGSEPGLETLRRQIKYQLDEIIGDGLIEEVLIPRCTPYRADF
jgi:flagellar basal body-associated protein FliL